MLAAFKRGFRESSAEITCEESGAFSLAYNSGTRLYRRGRPFDAETSGFSFVLFWDKDILLAEGFLRSGLSVFNAPRAIEICDNKLLTHGVLCDAGIPAPQTIKPPLVFDGCAGGGSGFLDFTAAKLGFPLVAKEAYGSLGEQVYLIKDRAGLDAAFFRLQYKPHLYQKFIAESAGTDIRIYVIGGKAIGACERRSEIDFRSNVQWGGTMRLINAEQEYTAAAEKAADTIGLDYCAVDFLRGKDGPLVCEVNSNAFFGAYCALGGRDIAALYARHILGKAGHVKRA